MTRLPWQHTRSRTKSGSEKTALTKPQDWFSRTGAEPSRQALTDLVKAHNRVKSDESHTTRTRTRTNTISSVLSQRARSRAGSTDDGGCSRPSSRSTHEDSNYPSVDRTGTPTKSIVSKSSQLLKRTSSRMSLASAASSSSLHGLTSPSRSSRPHTSSARTDELRSKISMPFDFQHITHTEETQFAGLRRIDESTLADQYRAVTTKQDAASALRGIAVSDLPPLDICDNNHAFTSDIAVSPEALAPPQLPQTPPRPQPPPKDDVILSRESKTDHAGHPRDSQHDQQVSSTESAWLAASAQTVEGDKLRQDVSVSKPLPELPVIHAITTEDDSARSMISGPLPSPPPPPTSVPNTYGSEIPPKPFQQRQRSASNLRYTSLQPSSKSSMPNLSVATHLLTAPRTLSRHHSDMALFKQTKNIPVTSSTRTSMSFAAIDTMNWEEAVDEAWDVVDDDDDDDDSPLVTLCIQRPPVEIGPIDSSAAESSSSTPLMMTNVQATTPGSPEKMPFAHGLEVHQLESVKEDEQSNDLAGLGISPCPASGMTSNVPRSTRSSSIHYPKRRSSLSYHGNDALTRSSSQESIIKSIASSIIATHRSSNSSVGGIYLAGNCLDENEDEYANRARPESGCLPPDILEQLSQFDTTPSAEHNSADDEVPPMPVLSGGTHRRSAPKPSVPERRSSVIATNQSGLNRNRSSTWGSRSRQSSQNSYSLFPASHPHPCTVVTS